ncbi:MAG: nitrilase family protein [Chitinophagaceae bacterium]|jgi:predicted amidohydrolase|nr:nitrilase family protein [Chitinophagaceae bacterium]OQY96814.1 MAG: nitrilase family protein [Sphingobacteriales bacterium UTBCD1]
MSTLTITTIQSNLHWENKAANLAMFERKIRSIQEETEIVVLPEMFSTGFSMNPEPLAETMEGETVNWMKRVAADNGIILTGSVIIKEVIPSLSGEAGKEVYFNRLIWMLPNGQFGYYDKRHRFAFAGEDDKYTAGTKRLIASAKGWKINLLVCYDLRFPVWSRQSPPTIEEPGKPEYDVLIYVANWPERRSIAWKTLLVARAIENQCYVVGVNRVGDDGHHIYHSGDSMIADPLGEILYHCSDEEDIFTIALDKLRLENIREKFPFWKDADRFCILNNDQ